MYKKKLKYIFGAMLLLSGIGSLQAQTQPTPGGLINSEYTWLAWLMPENYNAGTWTNLITSPGTVGDFAGAAAAPVKNNNGGFNFHPAVTFSKPNVEAAPNQLYSQGTYDDILTSENITCIFVFRRSAALSRDYLIGFSNADNYNAVSWRTDNNNTLSITWGNTTNRNVSNVNNGILTISNSNTTASANGIYAYINGAGTSLPSSQWNNSTNAGNRKVALGGGYNHTPYWGYQGNLQEVILLKKADNGHIDAADLQKIHSYLAIKYGIMLNNTDNYVNSAGTAVWDKTGGNVSFSNHIFGIGRDDASGLNQVQSRSLDSDIITLFKEGSTLPALNNNSSTAFAGDKTFLMLGSNNAQGNNSTYRYPENTVFFVGASTEEINFRSNCIYKAQVMVNGTSGGSQTTNMRVNYRDAHYVLVCPDQNFAPSNTRIYPIANQTVLNALVEDGDFITFAGMLAMPGGVTNPNYTWAAWLTPDSYNAGTWTNLITEPGTAGNFTAGVPSTPPVKVNSGYNFHPSVRFATTSTTNGPNWLATAGNYSALSSDNITVIFVMQRAEENRHTYDYLFSFNSGGVLNRQLWFNGSSNTLRLNWPAGGNRDFTFEKGIFSLSNANNSNSTGLASYVNGAKSTQTPGGGGAVNSRLVIGAGQTSSYYGFDGTVQEMILLKAAGTDDNHIDAADLQKIHSYLAIKYGITLNNTDNYVNSDNIAVWNRTTNNGYNNHIFGIGRDDASSLNQVQSRSQEYDMFTLFKETTIETLNNNNSAAFSNKTFLILGSNNQTGKTGYEHQEGTIFNGGMTIDEKINFRSSLVYKAQVTVNGIAGSESTNMQINIPNIRYVLVSSDINFAPGATRFYPVTNRIASDVLVNNGEFIAFAGFEPTPGGIDMMPYELDIWIDGNNSTGNSWPNLAYAGHQLTNVSGAVAPVVQNSKFNFNREIFFGNANNSKLRTAENFAMAGTESFYAFVVSENTGTSEHILLSYRPTNSDANARRTCLQWNSANIRAGWNGTITALSPAGTNRFGIAAMNIRSGAGANTSALSMNGGANTNFTAAAQNQSAVPLLVGNGNNATGNNLGFNGSIQEIILMRRSSNTAMAALDIAKIHSYLAIKYGITLNAVASGATPATSGDYYNSAGTVIWDRTLNTGYNTNIFGIARDDNSGLYQKQSRSERFRHFTVFTGDEIAVLNEQNTGTLDDGQYLMIGADSDIVLTSLSGFNMEDIYTNGTTNVQEELQSSTGYFNIQSAVYKAQLTGSASITVRMEAPSNDFTYVLVSEVDNFDPSNTKFYFLNKRIAEVEIDHNYKFFQFIGFAPGPGGVNPGLALWLRADDDASLDIINTTSSDGRLANYPNTFADPNNVPAVSAWKDLVRGHTYSLQSQAQARYPICEPNAPEMNFHPAVLFWANPASSPSSSNPVAYLGNAAGILTTARPQNDKHTAIFVTNSTFPDNSPRIYPLAFGSTISDGSYDMGPAYGVERYDSGDRALSGRFRVYGNGNNTDGQGVLNGTNNPVGNLFNLGATSILMYNHSAVGNQNSVEFRFNGKTQSRTQTTASWGTGTGAFNMSNPSKIGSPFYNVDRNIRGVMSEVIIYNGELNNEDRDKIESYLALKYGITLRPNIGNVYDKYNYKTSNGDILWEGDVDENDPQKGKYAKFYNNLAAVIRDDAARLHNRQSHSTDAGSLLHLGVAGTNLCNCGLYVGDLEYDNEAIMWGHDNATGITSVEDPDCGDFTHVFNRKWLLHKDTEDNRPLAMLVGAQNKMHLTIGTNINDVHTYYDKLTESYEVSMIIADSPEALDINSPSYNPKAIIPMTYRSNKHQCIYVFTEEDTYITFGYKPNGKGCMSSADGEFLGSKTFRWTEYNANTNRATGHVAQIPAIPTSANLGDNITVETQLTYASPVRATRGYPRAVNAPANGSLEIRRTQGVINNEVTIRITFSYPVIPEFSISGLDSRGADLSYDEVEIIGTCSGLTYHPVLHYVANPSSSSYTINGNTATAKTARSTMAASNRNGMVDVEFMGGVTEIIIKYRLKNRVRGTQSIHISPIVMRAILPPPPINEDGLSFVKQVTEKEIATCELVEYTFFIQNTNCDDKYISFTDILPSKMKWAAESIALDTVNVLHNQAIKLNNYGGSNTLTIDSLLIPGTTTVRLRAIAELDEDAPTGNYNNEAVISYDKGVLNPAGELISVNRETLDVNTTFHATQQEKSAQVQVSAIIDKQKYNPDDEITVTININNPNTIPLTEMYLDVDFNENFTYVVGSLEVTETIESTSICALADLHTIFFAGDCGSDYSGFILPPGESAITFKVKAPTEEVLIFEENAQGEPTECKETLAIFYTFSSEMDDLCLIEAVSQMEGSVLIPHNCKTITHIKTNRNKTMKVKK